MQAGLTKRAMTLREVFSSNVFLASKKVIFAFFETVWPVSFRILGERRAA
jgi:hypothetical protein